MNRLLSLIVVVGLIFAIKVQAFAEGDIKPNVNASMVKMVKAGEAVTTVAAMPTGKLDNDTYNKLKLVYTLAKASWFIEHHAIPDALKANDTASIQKLKDIKIGINNFVSTVQACLR